MSNEPGLTGVSNTPADVESPAGSSAPARHRPGGRSHFDIYRTEQADQTSALFGGGDWHWRLTAHSGEIIADCGGYRNQRDCLAAVEALRAEAGSAIVVGRSAVSRLPRRKRPDDQA